MYLRHTARVTMANITVIIGCNFTNYQYCLTPTLVLGSTKF